MPYALTTYTHYEACVDKYEFVAYTQDCESAKIGSHNGIVSKALPAQIGLDIVGFQDS